MFFYIGCLAGVGYYLFMILSGLFENQIEHHSVFSFLFGVAGCGTVIFINNNGMAGIILGLSLILVFIHINDQKMLTTSAFMDVLTAMALLYYSISVRSIAGIVFAVLLVIIAMAGLFSAVRLVKGGGLEAAAAEDALYRKQQEKKKERPQKYLEMTQRVSITMGFFQISTKSLKRAIDNKNMNVICKRKIVREQDDSLTVFFNELRRLLP